IALRRDVQRDRDRDRLVVVEEQRRKLAPGAELIATAGSGRALDGVAEAAQAVDVASQRAAIDPEALGELHAPPETLPLQEAEEAKQSRGGLEHRTPACPESRSGSILDSGVAPPTAIRRAVAADARPGPRALGSLPRSACLRTSASRPSSRTGRPCSSP